MQANVISQKRIWDTAALNSIPKAFCILVGIESKRVGSIAKRSWLNLFLLHFEAGLNSELSKHKVSH